jgi:hypothetical protein
MRCIFLIAAVILFSSTVTAQKKHALVFNSYNSVGFVAGRLPVTFAAQTENGIKFKNWFIGAGFGIDNYYKKTLPLFIAAKKEFPFKTNSLFLYVNAGTNFIAKDKVITNAFSTASLQGGFYADAGVGYKIKTTKRSNVFFSVGNTVKNIKETETTTDFLGMPGIYESQRKLSRIAFKTGYQF